VIAQSVQRWATGWNIGVLVFDSRRGPEIFLFTTASRSALGPTQPPIQWVPGALSLGVKRPEREANHSPPSSAEVKGCVELYLHSPKMPSWRDAHVKHRDNFTFYLYLLESHLRMIIALARWHEWYDNLIVIGVTSFTNLKKYVSCIINVVKWKWV
jgi:hypothetical protein